MGQRIGNGEKPSFDNPPTCFKSREAESRLVADRDWEERNNCYMGSGFPWGMTKVLRT